MDIVLSMCTLVFIMIKHLVCWNHELPLSYRTQSPEYMRYWVDRQTYYRHREVLPPPVSRCVVKGKTV